MHQLKFWLVLVFCCIGFMAHTAGKEVQDVVSGGIGLAFIAFQKSFQVWCRRRFIWSIVLLSSLFVAGISSMVSILEVPIAAMQDKVEMGP